MKKQLFKILPLAATACLLVFAGCQKEDDPQQLETDTVETEAITESEFTMADNFVEEAGNDDEFMNGRVAAATGSLPACATRTFNRETRTLTIDFGNTNCLCRDGRNRRGKIVASFNGPRYTAGSSVTITLLDYYVNDNHLTGTKTKTWVNANKVNVVVQDASIETARGTAYWEANRIIERIAGADTRILTDDIYLISGSSEGVNRQGVAFNTTIAQPLKLVLAETCVRNFVAGVVKTVTERGNTFVLNYDPIGGEPCDKIAEVTVNGRSKQIELR
ncbi:hypothetical protein [Pontibacter fetidus]|uniref:Lipoprotein n=1 Tax=Pontibacter fetidus TaxID=2700082 RepID=A0A6B2H055_9BACT|nr:hypothetical protein [Pontibacter fetidus]NDK56465.1 hypothetical protein [Pontibacter fetidus]